METLTYKQLQSLAKVFGIKANLSSDSLKLELGKIDYEYLTLPENLHFFNDLLALEDTGKIFLNHLISRKIEDITGYKSLQDLYNSSHITYTTEKILRLVELGILSDPKLTDILLKRISDNAEKSVKSKPVTDTAEPLPKQNPTVYNTDNVSLERCFFSDQNGTIYNGHFWLPIIEYVCRAYDRPLSSWQGGIIHFLEECQLIESKKNDGAVGLIAKPLIYSRNNLPYRPYNPNIKGLQDIGTLQTVEYLLGKPILKVSPNPELIKTNKDGLPLVEFFQGTLKKGTKVQEGDSRQAQFYRTTTKSKISTGVKNLAAKIPGKLIEIKNLNYKLTDNDTLHKDGIITVSPSQSILFTHPNPYGGYPITTIIGKFYIKQDIMGWSYDIIIDTTKDLGKLCLNGKYLASKIESHLFSVSSIADLRVMEMFGAFKSLHHSQQLGRKLSARQVKRGKQSGKKLLIDNYLRYMATIERKQLKGLSDYVYLTKGKDMQDKVTKDLSIYDPDKSQAVICFPFWLQNLIQKYLDIGHTSLELREQFNGVCLSVWYNPDMYISKGDTYVGDTLANNV